MLKSQNLDIERSDLRAKLNGLVETREGKPEYDEMRGKLADLDKRHAEALRAEAKETGVFGGEDSSEHREALQVTRKADLGVLVGALVSKRSLHSGSAEAEAQNAWGLAGDNIPLAMLAEYRVAAAPADGGGPQGFVGYRFPSTIADFANIQRPRVPAGTPVFPSITVASEASRPAEAAEVSDSDPTLRGELLTPKRIQANTKISVEDRARFGNMAAAIAAHLGGAVALGLDQQAMVGADGFFDTSSGPLTAPSNPGAASTYANYSAMLSGSVDGRYAENEAAVGLLVGMDTFVDGAAIYRSANSEGHLMEDLARRGRLRVSAAMAAKDGNNRQNVLAVRGSSPASVQPLWDDLRIEDVYSRSEFGEISFTIVALADFSVTQPAAYGWHIADVR